ncbi:MAG: hypothetical protein V1725_05690 [archaeon]
MSFADFKKTYRLPDWNVLNEQFEIGKLEENSDVLRQILKKTMEKIEFWTRFCEELVQPENLHSLQEADTLDEFEKKQALTLYRELMYYHRLCLEKELQGHPEGQATTIKQCSAEWPKLKEQILKLLKHVKEGWNTEKKHKEAETYFG